MRYFKKQDNKEKDTIAIGQRQYNVLSRTRLTFSVVKNLNLVISYGRNMTA
jgi:hypothetical protein